MSDAYGGISLATSDDCVVNAAALVVALNQFRWTNSGGEWVAVNDHKKDDIWYSDNVCQYPTAFPIKYLAVIVEQEDGELVRIPVEDATNDDYDNCCEMEEDDGECELKDVCEQLSPHIKNGWIEIACCANEKSRYVYFESLRVYANGNAKFISHISGPQQTRSFSEVYDPVALTQQPPLITI